MKFLLLGIAFYVLWLVRDISKYGILPKTREATTHTMLQAQDLIQHLKRAVVHADKTLADIKADYQVKTKALPQLLYAFHQLLDTLRFAIVLLCINLTLFVGIWSYTTMLS